MKSPIVALANVDFSPRDEPDPYQERRALLESWLDYQRHEFVRKLRDLTPDQMCEWAIPPVQLSVLGLVRHMTQIEHVYLVWGLGGGDRALRYGEDDYSGGSIATVEEDLRHYFAEVKRGREAVATLAFGDLGLGHGRPLEATLVKMVDEYAIHAGQAHMLRFAALGDIRR